MGRRGPVPEPTESKIRRGETRPSRLNLAEPKPRPVGPTMPRDMGDVAKAVWRHVIREMGATRIITGADAIALRCLCEAVERYREANDLLRRSGPLTRNDRTVVKNPLHQVVRDNANEIRLWARELGLTPSARAGLSGEIGFGGAAAEIEDLIGPAPRFALVAGGLDA